MAERAVAGIDHVASTWLARMEEDAVQRTARVPVLRRFMAFGLFALFVVPTIMSLFASPAIALPAGAAIVLASFLIVTAFYLGLRRPVSVTTDIANQSVKPEAFAAYMPGTVIFFDEQGTVQHVAGRDIDSFPKSIKDCAGQIFAERIHVTDRIAFAQALDFLRQGADQSCVELRFEQPALGRAADQFLHTRMDMTAIREANGDLFRVVGQLRDISEKEALRGEVARKVAEAESANDAKSRFLAAVSHELRTPLNAVLGFSDILAGEYFGKFENDRQREYVALIRQSGAHLLSVVNTMLDMSKLEAGRYELLMEPFNISESISTCEAMLGLQAKEKGVTLTSRVQRDLGEVVADQRAIQQVLINLAGNALKFTDAGGVVSMDAARDGNLLKISVSDTGIGIAADKIDLLGQPFMQVQNEYTRRYEGTGLGLSLVKGLVGLHGGRFAIASRPGEGTIVTVTLPIDGSGAIGCAQNDETERMVEFPPRLRKIASVEVMKEGHVNGTAKAKIA
ncbi:HAMP domain-containing sensor histidine kinase [Agrobacterium sp.]|uniref:sensor histidine kinase n=1 Tax=Agrobacterium sp. TaxID=361 RepID=UPI0028B1F84D|nr:HAMP domain-containing sensor histidine kinase [Agrobacterium sp.]